MDVENENHTMHAEHGVYADSHVLQCAGSHGHTVRHMGYGDFVVETVEGVVAFIRRDPLVIWDGIHGRAHQLTGCEAAIALVLAPYQGGA